MARSLAELTKGTRPTSLHDGRFVAGAHRQHLEHTAGCPQQFLIAVGSHDVDKSLRTSVSKDDELCGGQRGCVRVFGAKLTPLTGWQTPPLAPPTCRSQA